MLERLWEAELLANKTKTHNFPVDAYAGVKSAVQFSAVYTFYFTSYMNKTMTNQVLCKIMERKYATKRRINACDSELPETGRKGEDNKKK